MYGSMSLLSIEFLSTPSARRATVSFLKTSRRSDISIHALCEEGDICCGRVPSSVCVFLSTPSARRATQLPLPFGRRIRISIHALCEEGDFC